MPILQGISCTLDGQSAFEPIPFCYGTEALSESEPTHTLIINVIRFLPCFSLVSPGH